MELYLDTADIDEVKRLKKIFPISGVTTNPSIIAASRGNLNIILHELRNAIGPQGKLFAQVMSSDSDKMVEEAKQLRAVIPDIIVKVPTTEAGLTAIRQLKKLGIPTLGTVVYTAIQGLMAAMAGAAYVAPYVNRVDTQGGSGIHLVNELQTLLEKHAPSCQILAASFKTPRQALDCMLAGTGAITLPLDVVQHFLKNPAIDAAVSKFEQDWQEAFGRISLS